MVKKLTLLGILKGVSTEATTSSRLTMMAIKLLALRSAPVAISLNAGALVAFTISMIGSKTVEDE